MNKPISMSIKETKTSIIKACNDANLSPVILDLIISGIYAEIHALAEKQMQEDENAYLQTIFASQANSEKAEEENS